MNQSNRIHEHEMIITPSIADAAGKLSYHDAFGVFMDIAAIHAQGLGIGLYEMAAMKLFWLTVKTQIRFFERPAIMDRVLVRTWPEAPGKLRGNRSYQILRSGQLLAAGKTEWAVINTQTNQLILMSEVYPPALSFERESACPEPFARISDDFSDSDVASHYIVRSSDIDVGGHMNNAAYVRAMLGSFSSEELSRMRIGRIDVLFRSPCFEGNDLVIQKKQTDAGLDLRISNAGTTSVLARIE